MTPHGVIKPREKNINVVLNSNWTNNLCGCAVVKGDIHTYRKKESDLINALVSHLHKLNILVAFMVGILI